MAITKVTRGLLSTGIDDNSNATAITIDSSENVGIGATTIDEKLHVETSSGDAAIKLEDASGDFVRIDQNSVGANDKIRFKSGSGLDERMRIHAAGDVSIGTTAGSHRLYVNDATNQTEASAIFRLEGAGYSAFHFLDGTAYTIGQNSNSRALRIYSGSNESAGAQLSAGGTSFGTYSDERLKENIQDIGSVTDKIKDIRCVSFNRTDIENSKETIGFIAQDFVGKFDQVLDKTKLKDSDEEEYYLIKYTETIPVLLKAIQEQQTIIDDLKTRIETLENA
tara:strand:- start:9 stop:848 length:840 start_codon:yes stop_codon:yes gene_type:complete